MSAQTKILLFFIIFFLICVSSGIFFLKKLEAKREEEVFLTCQKVLQEKDLILESLQAEEGFEIFKDDDFFDFQRKWQSLLTSYQKEVKTLDEIPQNNHILPADCSTALLQNGQQLGQIEKRLAYLSVLKKGFEDFQKTNQYLEVKGFTGLDEEWVKLKKEAMLAYERELEDLIPPVDQWQEIDRQFKKTFRAFVELWSNTEVALKRKTPVIYSSSYRVFKEDFNQLTIDLEKLEMLP